MKLIYDRVKGVFLDPAAPQATVKTVADMMTAFTGQKIPIDFSSDGKVTIDVPSEHEHLFDEKAKGDLKALLDMM